LNQHFNIIRLQRHYQHNSVRYYKSTAKRGAIALRVSFEFCTLRTSTTNLRAFRINWYIFFGKYRNV